jgi:hypothetical protein
MASGYIRDASDDAQRLAHAPGVQAAGDLLGVLALQQLGHGGGELDVLDAAGHFAQRIRHGLAVFTHQRVGQHLAALLHEGQELEQHARAGQRRRLGPGLGGFRRAGHGGVQVGHAAQQQLALHGAGGRVVDVLLALGLAAAHGTVDPVRDFVVTHDDSFKRTRPAWGCWGAWSSWHSCRR